MLFVHYESMAGDFGAVRDAVAGFLGYTLTSDEKRRIDEKCSFRYMKAHEASFEMASPTMFSVGGAKFMRGGTSDSGPREGNLPPVVRERILAYCREGLSGSTYPVARFYPDLAVKATARPIAARVADGAA